MIQKAVDSSPPRRITTAGIVGYQFQLIADKLAGGPVSKSSLC